MVTYRFWTHCALLRRVAAISGLQDRLKQGRSDCIGSAQLGFWVTAFSEPSGGSISFENAPAAEPADNGEQSIPSQRTVCAPQNLSRIGNQNS